MTGGVTIAEGTDPAVAEPRTMALQYPEGEKEKKVGAGPELGATGVQALVLKREDQVYYKTGAIRERFSCRQKFGDLPVR